MVSLTLMCEYILVSICLTLQILKAHKTVVSSSIVDAKERRTCIERLCQVSSFFISGCWI